jgi:hypothetical protein
MWIMSLVTISAGITVFIGAYKIHKEPERIRRWGFVILGASIIGIFCASGFGIGGGRSGNHHWSIINKKGYKKIP